MNLKTKKINIIEQGVCGESNRELEVNVIEEMSFDLIGYPEFNTENVCLCSRKHCKELQVDLKVTLSVDRNEYFELLGLIAKQNAVTACMEDAPINIKLKVDIEAFKKAFEKMM